MTSEGSFLIPYYYAFPSETKYISMFTRSTTSSLFPLYLCPSIPLRRQNSSTSSANPADSSETVAPTSQEPYLHGHSSHLQCAKCATDVCLTSQIISKGFTGRHGRAYLISPSSAAVTVASKSMPLCLANTKTDAPSQRQLVTGVHTVSDVRCAICGSMLGWKYDGAEEESQRYKVGKYILETKMVCSSIDWEHKDLDTPPSNLCYSMAGERGSLLGDVEFDSQDEDECEDLFAGVWNPALATKRRRNKSFRKALLDMEARAR